MLQFRSSRRRLVASGLLDGEDLDRLMQFARAHGFVGEDGGAEAVEWLWYTLCPAGYCVHYRRYVTLSLSSYPDQRGTFPVSIDLMIEEHGRMITDTLPPALPPAIEHDQTSIVEREAYGVFSARNRAGHREIAALFRMLFC